MRAALADLQQAAGNAHLRYGGAIDTNLSMWPAL
jgi:hypothetical protein